MTPDARSPGPAPAHDRPLVAVTGRPTVTGKPWKTAGFGSPRLYLDALDRAGGLGAVLQAVPTSPEDAAARVAPFAGLLMTGGPDVDPARYGQAPHPATYGVNALVDHFEEALLRAALACGRPVLAICRGLQLVNVAFGGTLHQHVDDLDLQTELSPTDSHGNPGGEGGSVDVAVVPGSLLADALGTVRVRTSCFHHQAVDALGDGLVVSANAADGLTEGLELAGPGPWMVAVQWHPEQLAGEGGPHQAIFDSFVAACRAASGPQRG